MQEQNSIGNIKSRAKHSLQKGLGTSYLMIITSNTIQNIIIKVFSSIFMISSLSMITSTFIRKLENQLYYSENDLLILLRYLFDQINVVLILQIVIYFLTAVTTIMLFNHLTTGIDLWFSRNREGTMTPPYSFLFYQFNDGRYFSTMKGMAWRDLWLFIWRLPASILSFIIGIYSIRLTKTILQYPLFSMSQSELEKIFNTYFAIDHAAYFHAILFFVAAIVMIVFSILAIVKKYSYPSTEWLLADNPHLNHRQALNLSKKMMHGNKFKWFLLDLSFIGWKILYGILIAFSFFLKPLLQSYIKAAHAELYADLRSQAIADHLITPEELGFVKETANQNESYQSATDFYQSNQQ